MSDFQLGMRFANEGMVARAVETAVAADPDLVLLGGDFLYSTTPDVDAQVDRVLELLDPLLASGIPTYAVLGNHDYAAGGADEVARALEGVGVQVLRNQAVAVPGPTPDADQQLYVVGVGPDRPDLVDIDAALADVPDTAPRIVLMHNPTVFNRMPAGTAPLTMAGHTHCGQVAMPLMPHWSYLGLTAEEAIVADGWAPDDLGATGNRLFVTCGIGFSMMPLRINAPPQVAFFDLRPAT
nr:metallophosphoesterase [Salsipaludibacter albus]